MSILRIVSRSGLLVTSVLALSREARAANTEIGTAAELEAQVATLKAGDTLTLRGGTYSMSKRFLLTVKGTAAAPIVIQGKAGERAIITRADEAENTVNVDASEYLTLRSLDIKGGSACMAIGNSNFITIESSEIYNCGDVAIAANRGGTMKGFVIRKNHIHDTNGTGEGMYLGCNDASCTLNDSIIERNYVHHTDSATVEQGDGIEVKKGSTNNMIRDNVIHNTKYPCITTYSTTTGVNTFERNAMWKCGDHGIQATADVVIRNNIILSAVSEGIRLQTGAAGTPKNAIIINNTVIKVGGTAIRIDAPTGPVTVANNAIYATAEALRLLGGTATIKNNVGKGSIQGFTDGFTATGNLTTDFIAANESGTVPNNVFPKIMGALVSKSDASLQPSEDFDGTPRAGSSDVGAYKYDASGMPKWPLAAAFKGIMDGAGPGGSDAGTSSGGIGSSGGGASSGGVGSGGGGTPMPVTNKDDSGCGCHQSRSTSGSENAAALGLFALLELAVRRRQSAR
jgi:Right handed beta helix region